MSIPQRNLYQLRKYFFKHLQLRIRDIVKQQILVSIFLLIFRQEPKIIISIRHHVCQCKFFFLRQVYCQLHVVRRTFIRHQPTHILLEERLSPHHQMRKHGLIGRIIAKMLITGEYIVHKSSSAPPVPQNKHRIMLQRLIRQQLLITFVLQ